MTLQRWKTVAASLVVAGTLVLLAPWTMAGCGEDKLSGARTATTGTSPSSTEATDDGLQPTPKETSSPPGIKQELFFTAAWGAVNGEFGVEFPNESTGMGPTTLAARNGYVYVPDPVNRRIQRIDPSGTVDQVIELPEGFLIEDLAVAADGTLVVVDPIVSETSLAFTPDGERAGEAPLRQAPPGSSNIPYLWLTAAGGAVYIGMVEEPGPPVWIPIYDTDGLHDPRETREQAFSDEPVDQGDGIFLRRPWRGPNEDPPTEPQFPDLVRQGEPLSGIPTGQLGVENVEAALGLEIARLDDGSFLATAVMINEQDWPGPMRWVAWLSPLGEPQSGTGTDRPTDSLATLDGLAPNVSVDPAGSVYVLTTDDAGLRITRFFLTESSRPPGFGSKIDGLPATEDRFSAEADAFADAVAGKLAGTGLKRWQAFEQEAEGAVTTVAYFRKADEPAVVIEVAVEEPAESNGRPRGSIAGSGEKTESFDAGPGRIALVTSEPDHFTAVEVLLADGRAVRIAFYGSRDGLDDSLDREALEDLAVFVADYVEQ